MNSLFSLFFLFILFFTATAAQDALPIPSTLPPPDQLKNPPVDINAVVNAPDFRAAVQSLINQSNGTAATSSLLISQETPNLLLN